MKHKIFLLAGLAACLSVFTSCEDYLDRAPDDKTTEQQVFTRYEKVDGLVSDLYANCKYANKPLIKLNQFSISRIS